MPILAIKDRRSGIIQVVPAKGIDKWAIRRSRRGLEPFDYESKSDNGASDLALKRAVKDTTQAEVILEEILVGVPWLMAKSTEPLRIWQVNSGHDGSDRVTI